MLAKIIYLFVGIMLPGHLVVNGQKCSGNALTNSQLVKTYSEGNLHFALDMYKNAANGKTNAFISPFSIGVALAMTSAGAGGKTLRQMTDTLRLKNFSDEKNVHQAIHSVLNSVCSTPDYTLSTANKIYVQKDFAIKTPFRNTLTSLYKSSADTADFKTKANEEAKVINKWVEEQTQNHIRDLFPAGSLDSETVLVLVNAIYFKGNWKTKFLETKTQRQTFKLTNGRKITHPMMNIGQNFKYTESNELNSQIIELPYQGDRLVMFVVLPKEVNGINQLKEQLTADSFKSLKNQMRLQHVIVKMPKFKLNYKNKLNDILSKMGMSELFDEDLANLSRIAQPKRGNLYVSIVIHQAFISVDEEGTTAAAATGVAVSFKKSSIRAPPPVNFIADHPFIFIIYDKLTNLILFIGNVDDPSL